MSIRKKVEDKPVLKVISDADAPAPKPTTPETEPAPESATPAPQILDTSGTGDATGKDLADLWIDTGVQDPLAADQVHTVPFGKPRDFFRTVPDRNYRRKTMIYVHKSENSVGEQYFIIAPSMQDKVIEARPCTIVTVVDRLNNPRLWALISPRPGENAFVSHHVRQSHRAEQRR
jgi:hypothetical protein